jgi:8-oxo-dGTP diphosphatase
VTSTSESVVTATNSAGYRSPAGITADIVALTVRASELLVLLVERPEGGLALPGAFVRETETAEGTAARALEEKTGLIDVYLEQLSTFTNPARDPRGWIPTIAYLVLVPSLIEPEEREARWTHARSAPPLAFDHDLILRTAVERAKGKLWWSNIAAGILAKPFTLAEARRVYEAIAGIAYDPSTFARDLRSTGLIEPTGERRSTKGRSAALFTFRNPTQLLWGAGYNKRRQSGP